MPAPKTPKRYLRRSERVGDQVKTHYLGRLSDPVNRILLQSEELSQALQRGNRDAAQEELARQERLEILQQFLATKINRMVWRHRRQFLEAHDKAHQPQTQERKMTHPPPPGPKPVTVSRDDWDEIVAKASDGDKLALEELKRILRYDPKLCEKLGDLHLHIQSMLIDIIGAESLATREALKLQIAGLRQTLDQTQAHPLERLLIEQLVTTLLDLSIQQLGCAQPHAKETLRVRWERRLDRAQKRHLAAVKALAEFRVLVHSEA
jgi:hypothetical protein